MAIKSDEHDILEVFVITNLANIAENSPFVAAPLGLQNFIDTVTVDNVSNLNFPSDIRDLLVNYILTRQLGDRSRNNISRKPAIVERRRRGIFSPANRF